MLRWFGAKALSPIQLGELMLLGALVWAMTVLHSLGFREVWLGSDSKVLMQAVKDPQHGQDYTKLHKRHPGVLKNFSFKISWKTSE